MFHFSPKDEVFDTEEGRKHLKRIVAKHLEARKKCDFWAKLARKQAVEIESLRLELAMLRMQLSDATERNECRRFYDLSEDDFVAIEDGIERGESVNSLAEKYMLKPALLSKVLAQRLELNIISCGTIDLRRVSQPLPKTY